MIVALDGTPTVVSSGGLRRYTEELSRALCQEFPQDTFRLVSDQLQRPRNILERRWWSIGLPLELRRTRCDLFHGTDFAVPYIPLRPSVMTVHDLSPWLEAEWHHNAARVRRRTPLLLRSGIATAVITPTHAVRRQLIERFRLRPDRVFAVHEAAASHLQPAEPYPGNYFLFVGTIEPRKNVPLLIRQWAQIRSMHPAVDLVIAGRSRKDAPRIPSQPGLQLLGEVPEQQLASLYSGAIALVYPSAYEGFGLPVVEAMQCGAAVIASRDPALMEVADGAALHEDPDQLARAMLALLNHPEELLRRREFSSKRARDFSWARTARETMEVYVEAIRRF